MSPPRVITNRNLANNPVARAMAREKLKAALLDQKIKLYMTEDKASTAGFLEGIGMTLSVVGMACELDPSIGGDDVDVRILRGGLSAVQQMVSVDRYDSAQTPAVARALDCAESLNTRVRPDYVTQAFVMLSRPA